MSVRKWTVKRLGAEAPSTETKKITSSRKIKTNGGDAATPAILFELIRNYFDLDWSTSKQT